jgi:hypothetical protein
VLRSRVRLPGARSNNLALRACRALWTAPTNLLGHLAGFLVSGRRGRRVGGPAARGWLFEIRPGLGLDWVGAVTIGHAILYRPDMFGGGLRGRLVLAHELAHTRQHDVLGPLYLPLHILAQATSAVLSIGRPVVVSRVHDRNPLEQTFICLGAGAPLLRNPRTGSEPPAMRSLEHSSSSRDANHTPLPAGFDVENFLGRFQV